MLTERDKSQPKASFEILSQSICILTRVTEMNTNSSCCFIEHKSSFLNSSFTKPCGTHTFYQGGGGGTGPPAISETVALMNLKFCKVLETPLKVLEMLKLFT